MKYDTRPSMRYTPELEGFNEQIRRFNFYKENKTSRNGKVKEEFHIVGIQLEKGDRIVFIKGYYPENGELSVGNYHIYNDGVLLLNPGLEARIREVFSGNEELEDRFREEFGVYEAEKPVVILPIYEGVQQNLLTLPVNEVPEDVKKNYKIMNIRENWEHRDAIEYINSKTPRHL